MTTINNVSSVNSYYNTQNTTTTKTAEVKASEGKTTEDKAAVYESGDNTVKKTYKKRYCNYQSSFTGCRTEKAAVKRFSRKNLRKTE